MTDLAPTLGILSAMIMPAILILACGSLILATSQRLGRIIDRTRFLGSTIADISGQPETDEAREKHDLLLRQLVNAVRRSRLLQHALTFLLLALGFSVGTSFAIAIVAVGLHYSWIPVPFGLLSVALLFYASILLILESRLGLAALNEETNYFMRRSRILWEERSGRPGR